MSSETASERDKSTVEVLREARELISDPGRWTRGAYARNELGEPAGDDYESGDPLSEDAVCWCAQGAIAVAAGELDFQGRAVDCLRRAIEQPDCDATGVVQVHYFNDGRRDFTPADRPRPAPARHRKVLAAFDKAIELAEASS